MDYIKNIDKMTNKKGVSNIILSVLLILFIITISTFVFTWIKKTTEGSMEKTDVILEKLEACQDIDFEIEDAYCKEDVIVIRINNNRNIDFKDGFSLKLIYEENEEGNEISTFVYGTELKAYETVDINGLRQFKEGAFGKEYFKIKDIEVVPKLLLDNKVSYCNDKKQILQPKDC